MLRTRFGWIIALLLAAAVSGHAIADAPPLAIEHVTAVDVVQGILTPPRTVLIEHGRIAAVAKPGAVTIPPGVVRVDGQGRFLIPGLADMHVHLFNNATHRAPNDWMFALFVANGVTGVREMAATPRDMQQVARWREAVDGGALVAPHVLAAGVVVNDAADVREQVREAAGSGADFIKVFSELSPSSWRAVLDEARLRHIPVAGHVPVAVAAVDAAQAGQVTAEHLMQIYEACSSIEGDVLAARRVLDGAAATAMRDAQEMRVLRAFDPAACAKAAKAVALAGQAQTPTLTIDWFDPARFTGDYTADPRWHLLRADEQARWRRYLQPASAADRKLADLRWEVSCRIVRTLHVAGANILAGADTPMPWIYPGYSLHDELERLVDCGLSPVQALRAATIGAVKFLGLDADRGTIEAGKRADLVLLDANPLKDARNLRRIHAVVLAGRLLRRADMDLPQGP
ncbi:MAG: amidohydrolase family protein [Proteobacteria bacterium]|nr:amidohydrolase family protein [Pseudomonadota bacterium]